MVPQNPQHRILIVDDSEVRQEDFRRILTSAANDPCVTTERALSVESIPDVSGPTFEIHAACQSVAACNRVQEELLEGRRFALAIVDMPARLDGIETVRRLWKLDSDLQVAFVMPTSDRSWREVVTALGGTDRLQIVRKPLDFVAVRQLAVAASVRFDLQQRLKSRLDELEEIVAERNEDVSRARDAAQRAAAKKGRYLANMSHEIRTPLSGILGMSELLLSTTLTSEQREYASATHSSAQTLLTQLNDVLDLSRLESDELKTEHRPFSMRALIDEIVTLMRPNTAKKNLRLNHSIPEELPALVSSDSARIRQILTNLISNAIRFTPAGSVDVSISITVQAADSVNLLLHVSGTGVGIPPETLDTIFSAFVQSDDSTTRLFGGTGLGLAISRQLAELLGGSLTVASIPGEGASFTVHLDLPIAEPSSIFPVAPSHDGALDGRADTERTSADQVRVLLVDDHPFNRLFARRSLEKLNCCVAIADNGKQAVELYRDSAFDLILMDCMMPVMDGYSATQAIRQLEGSANRRTPIVALTAQFTENDRARCMAADMDDFVSKPLSIETLRNTVERWAGQTLIKKEESV